MTESKKKFEIPMFPGHFFILISLMFLILCSNAKNVTTYIISFNVSEKFKKKICEKYFIGSKYSNDIDTLSFLKRNRSI